MALQGNGDVDVGAIPPTEVQLLMQMLHQQVTQSAQQMASMQQMIQAMLQAQATNVQQQSANA